jgi:hypothetical protein
MTNCSIALIRIKKNKVHAKILYELLLKRRLNISHLSMPSYIEHEKFVLNHPYRFWYFIKQNNNFIGSIYILKNNCIGVNVVENSKIATPIVINKILSKHKPLGVIKSIREAHFDFNVTPSDADYLSILEAMGAKLVQLTFVIQKN